MLKPATQKWVAVRDLQGAGWGFGLATCLGAFAAWVRLLPWMFAREIPSGVIWPFARVLLASGLELALQVGLPLGWLVGWLLAIERGEVRALTALGLRPTTLAFRSVIGLSMLGFCVASGARLLSGPVEGAPTQVLSELVRAGQRYCDSHPNEIARIPVAGLAEHCQSRRLVGRVPGAQPAWFAISDLHQASVSEFELGASEWLVRTGPGWIHVDVERARVRGVMAPTATARGWARAVGLALSVGCFGWLIVPLLRVPRVRGTLVFCVLATIAGVVLLKELDARVLSSAAYLSLLVPVGVAWTGALVLSLRAPRRLSR
ncbi:MAG: hypothetical protein AB7K71_31040 [Polyangiaceae bacterium]